MIDRQDVVETPLPSKSRIAKATLVAFLLAAVLLVTIVLPAEYSIDPLGTGAALGLLELSQAEGSGPVVPVQAGIYRPETRIYKVDSQELFLMPGEGVEIKYHLAKGAAMVYSWKATGKVQYEFHGEPDQKPSVDYYDSYELDDKVGKDQGHGSFIAPSTGIHGWFWENKGDKEVELQLRAAGFFDGAKMFAGGPPEDLPVEDAK